MKLFNIMEKFDSPTIASPGLDVTLSQIEKLSLEDIVVIANKVGLEFVNAKKEAERLDMMKNTVRSQIMNRMDDGNLTEAKLRRACEASEEYSEFIQKLVNARAESEKLRIRYESYKNLFEAKRSTLSYQKAEMKLL